MMSHGRIPQNCPGPAPRRPRTNSPRCLVAVLPVALLALLPEGASADVTHLVVPVRGMTCALCTRGVEESIKSLGGAIARADLATARVHVEAASGRSLVVRDVKERILSAGFGIGGEVEATASGRFLIGPDRRITFRVANGAYLFQVLEGEQLRRIFKRSPSLKGDFLLRFRLHDHAHWKPPAISITSFEVQAPAPPPAAR